MNKLTIIGNLTADPQSRTVNVNGTDVSVCNFSVAANSGFGQNQKTTYFRVSAWRGLAETCQKYLTKGRKVCVIGEVSARAYTGNDGNTYVNLEVRADDIEFCGGSVNTANAANPDSSDAAPANTPNYDAQVEPQTGFNPVETDELPF